MHFYRILTEPSSHGAGGSGGTGNFPPRSVDETLLGPNQEDIVDVYRHIVLTKGDAENIAVTPFKNAQGEFLQYKIGQIHGEVVKPQQWITDIRIYAQTHGVGTLQ